MRSNNLKLFALLGASAGYTAGIWLSTLVSFVAVFRFRISVNALYLFLYLFVSAVVAGNDIYTALGYLIITFLMIQGRFLVLPTEFFLALFYFHIFGFLLTGSLFEYVGGFSGFGFLIVNDFAIQFMLVCWILYWRTNTPLRFIYLFCSFLISYMNSAEILIIANFTLVIRELVFAGKYILLKMLVIAIMLGWLTFTFQSELFLVFNLVKEAADGGACGSRCFRVFALWKFFNEFLSSPLLGIGIGHTSSNLVALQSMGELNVMSGSMHNIFFQFVFEVGLLGLLLFYVAFRRRDFSKVLIIIFIGSLSAVGPSVFNVPLLFLLSSTFLIGGEDA